MDLSINFGGVSIPKDAQKSTTVKNGTKYYTVYYNGIKYEYPEQNKSNKAVICLRQANADGRPYYISNPQNLTGATITGSNKYDYITLEGCQKCKVDISQPDNKKDFIIFKKSQTRANADNFVKPVPSWIKQNVDDMIMGRYKITNK